MSESSGAPAELLNDLLKAAERMVSPAASDQSAALTPYGELTVEQFAALANLLASTPGTTVADAKALLWTARRMTLMFNQTVLDGHPNWDMSAFALALLERLHDTIQTFPNEPGNALQ